MISKTQLKQRVKRKTNSSVVETLTLAKHHAAWGKVAHRISGPTRQFASFNLRELDARMKEGETMVVPGKVLGVGMLSKKGKVCALSFSESARAKLHKAKCAMSTIAQEIASNPKAEGVVIVS